MAEPQEMPYGSAAQASFLSMGGVGACGWQIAGYRQGAKKTGVLIVGVFLVIPPALLGLMAVCSLQGCVGPAGQITGGGSWETGEQLGKLPLCQGKTNNNKKTPKSLFISLK